MLKKPIYSLLVLFFFYFSVDAQNTAILRGKITAKKGKPIEGVNVSTSNDRTGIITDASGKYSIDIPSNKDIVLSITHIGYINQQWKVNLDSSETRIFDVKLKESNFAIPEVEVEAEKDRENTMEALDPKNLKYIPSPNGSFEAAIKTLMGVSSNNELSSQYNVRGGSFDENLVYVNDIEIYRPFLTRSGNQEGLSFINADLVHNIDFSAGGFEARYGDKMSSVLAVEYKEPKKFSGSVTGGLQGGAIHVEGSSENHRFTHITGIRYNSNAYVLGSLDTDGDYRVNFADVQTYLTYDISDKWEIGFLGNYARNQYNFVPETRETAFGTIQEALKLTIFFEGQEVTDFETYFGAITNTYRPNSKLELKLITSAFQSRESETFDILGQYRIDELERDLSSDNFGGVSGSRGVGSYLNHARNYLNASVANAQHRGKLLRDNGSYEWGAKFQHEQIQDQLKEWDLIDSAGFSLPQVNTTPGVAPNGQQELVLFNSFRSSNTLSSNRLMGYAQRTIRFSDKKDGAYTLTAGIRANHWDLNQETVFSPRANLAWEPDWERDFLFRFSTGFYHQPAFYRELRDFEGNLNRNIKAQRSIHYVLGADYNFTAWGRPFKFVAEAYYKQMDNIIPYEIDNVRIRYYAENNADAFAMGADFKINGQFVKGVDSWLNIGFLNVQENIKNDSYTTYFNTDGEEIQAGFTSNTDTASFQVTRPGHIPRPTDQRFNLSLFFQDYLPKNPTYKMHLTFHYGSGLPFGPPSNERFKDTLRIPAYLRVDMGFSKQLLGEDSKVSPTSPFRHFNSIWIGLDIFNLLQKNNTLSYLWVTDVSNRQYAVPNFLTSRQINLRLQMKF